jgi:radical SAM superfamily enzyme
LEKLDPAFVIERFARQKCLPGSEGPAGLIRNDQVLALIEKRMVERNTWQGKKFKV